MGWNTENKYFSGQGTVLLGSRDAAGAPMGLRPVGNVSALGIAIETSVTEHKESETGQRSVDLRLTTETKCNLSITMESFSKKNLEQALRGEQVDVVGATVTAEVVKAYPGAVSPLNRMKISSVVVTLVAGSVVLTPYVNDETDWDYKVNAEAGSLLFNSIADADNLALDAGKEYGSVTVGYTFAAQSLTNALTKGAQELYMRFEGLNTAQENEPVVIEIFRFMTDPLQELALIGDDIQQFVLEGSVLADSLRASGSKFFTIRQLA